MGCLNCNVELKHTPGKRKKQFCSPDCRVRYWQKNKPKKEKDYEKELEAALTEPEYRKRLQQANKDLFTYGFAIIPDDPKEPLISPMSERGLELISLARGQNKPNTAPETGKSGKTTQKEEKGKEGAENGVDHQNIFSPGGAFSKLGEKIPEISPETGLPVEQMPEGLTPIQQAVWKNNQKMKTKKAPITQFGVTKKDKNQ